MATDTNGKKPPDLEKFNTRHPLMKMGFKVEEPPLSSSYIGTRNRCRRKGVMRYRLGLVPRGFVAHAGVQGGWLHSVLRGLVQGEEFSAVESRVRTELRLKIDEASRADGVVQSGLMERLDKDLKKALAMGRAFIQIAQDRDLPLVNPGVTEILGVEREIRCDLEVKAPTGPPMTVRMAGTLDLITRNRESGRITIHDYKRAGRDAKVRATTALIEPQPWVYRLLADSVGWNASFFTHWLMESPTIRQKTRPPEKYEDYLDRVVEWYYTKQQERPENPPIVVSTVPFSGPLLTREMTTQLRDAWSSATSPLKLWEEAKTGAPEACVLYGRPCAYLDLCVTDLALWPDILLSGFAQEFRYADDEFGDVSGTD